MGMLKLWCWCFLFSCMLSSNAAAWTTTGSCPKSKIGTYYKCPSSDCGICYCSRKGETLPPDPCKTAAGRSAKKQVRDGDPTCNLKCRAERRIIEQKIRQLRTPSGAGAVRG